MVLIKPFGKIQTVLTKPSLNLYFWMVLIKQSGKIQTIWTKPSANEKFLDGLVKNRLYFSKRFD
jgi:hypothetical protein